MIGSVLNEGARGLQNSQREIARAATEISRANVRPDASAPATATEVNAPTPFSPVAETSETERQGGISEPLIELRRQEQLFTASAEVVSTANDALGSLLDTQA